MSTVVLRLAAPMQSWGDQARASQIRPTSDHPTKAGVVGLVANILGRDRSDSISDLAALTFAVRADLPGTHEVDYQTAGSGRFPMLPGEMMASPKLRRLAVTGEPADFTDLYSIPKGVAVKDGERYPAKGDNASLNAVHYLADAIFTAALAGPDALIAEIAEAAHNPARTPYLGRAAYFPSEPLLVAVHDDTDPSAVLGVEPAHERTPTPSIPLWAEVSPLTPNAIVVADQPVDYTTRQRVGRAELRTLITPPTAVDTDIPPADDAPDPLVAQDFFA